MKQKKNKKYTKPELKAFKEILQKTKADILEQILSVEKENLRTSQKDASGDLSGYSIHMADMATDSYDREFSLNRASVEQKIIYQIDEALKRIEDGEYGMCMACGNLIAKKRLKAVPHAKFCVTCQGVEENKKTDKKEQ